MIISLKHVAAEEEMQTEEVYLTNLHLGVL
jgi:hypothetical protein